MFSTSFFKTLRTLFSRIRWENTIDQHRVMIYFRCIISKILKNWRRMSSISTTSKMEERMGKEFRQHYNVSVNTKLHLMVTEMTLLLLKTKTLAE